MKLGMDVGLGPGRIVLDKDPSPAPPPLPKKAQPPIFGPRLCGQTVGWIKMKLGMEVGRSPGHIVSDGDTAPTKGHSPTPVFGPCPLWPNDWMH